MNTAPMAQMVGLKLSTQLGSSRKTKPVKQTRAPNPVFRKKRGTLQERS